MHICLRSLSGNLRGPVYTESLLAAWHLMIQPRKARNTRKAKISLMLGSFDGEVGLAIECADELRSVIVPELQDAYPGLEVELRRDPQEGSREGQVTRSIELALSPDAHMLRTYESFVDEPERALADPIAGLLSAVRSGRSGRLVCSMRLTISPASSHRTRQLRRINERLQRGFRTDEWRRRYARWACDRRAARRLVARIFGRVTRSTPHPSPQSSLKAAETLFACRLMVECRAPVDAAQIAGKRVREMAAAFGRFATEEGRFLTANVTNGANRKRGRGFLLTPKEIATLWHPPVVSANSVSRMSQSEFRELESPIRLPSKEESGEVTLLGRVKFRNQRNQFGIRADDLRRHLMVVGKTGCGKSTFLQHMVLQQMQQRRGVVLIDPHGQLVEELLDHVPKHRTNDVILFDAADRLHPVGFNPLRGPVGSDPTLVADSVLTAFKKVFGFDEATAPRLLHIFRNCLLTLVGTPQASLMSIQRLLTDAGYRKSMVGRVENAAVRDFWLSEFNRWSDRDRTQYIASLQNKLGAFTSNERLQAILCATEQGIDLRSVLDRSQILLCNLSKGTMGHDASTLLGSLLLSSLQLAAMSRADVPESERPDASVIVDEFHSFLSEGNTTMADALAESRKYRTSYILATQMLDQLDTATLSGVLGNCGTTLCMTVGPRDAETLAELLGEDLTPQDLMRIPQYHGYLRLLTNGTARTFSMTTLPPPPLVQRRAEIVRRVSRQRHAMCP